MHSDKMGAFRILIILLQIGILLINIVCLTNGKTYVATKNTKGKKVQNVNRVFVSSNIKNPIKCALKCRDLNCTSFSYGEKFAISECYPSFEPYMGRQARTYSGEVCQRWDTLTPHHHPYHDPSRLPDLTLADASNFCRDPNRAGTPFCYTTNPTKSREYCPVRKCGHEFYQERCYKDTHKAKDYNGPWNRTRSGKVCQRWDAQSPHDNRDTSSSGYPDNTISDAENYCRDPSDSGYTWCYTMEPGTRWEACDVTSCTKFLNDKSCYETESHLQYTGNWDMTVGYKKCQRWDSQTPHKHPQYDAFPDDTLEDAGNYCRDPSGRGFLWCLTVDQSIEMLPCAIWKCPPNHVTCYDSPTVRAYMGTWSTTESGKTCQRWDSQLPHSHTLTADMFQEDTLTDAENFCRDPTGSGELWCYTTDPKTPKEECGIGNCSGENTCQAYIDEAFSTGSDESVYYKSEL